MDDKLSLSGLLARSDGLYSAWEEALSTAAEDAIEGLDLRDHLTLDACMLTLEHGRAIRGLVEQGLENSALALLRVQHEALLRATWIGFAADENSIRLLAAPQTSGTLKQANGLPLAHALLDQVEKSDAPQPLKRGLREFRDTSWAGVNSYAHAGLLPLGRIGLGHGEAHLKTAVQASNAHGYAANMLAADIIGDGVPAIISVIAVSFPGCMLPI